MTARKIAISLPPELAEQVRQDASREGRSVSGWLADAASRKLRRKLLADAVADYESEHGEITTQELARVRRVWPERK